MRAPPRRPAVGALTAAAGRRIPTRRNGSDRGRRCDWSAGRARRRRNRLAGSGSGRHGRRRIALPSADFGGIGPTGRRRRAASCRTIGGRRREGVGGSSTVLGRPRAVAGPAARLLAARMTRPPRRRPPGRRGTAGGQCARAAGCPGADHRAGAAGPRGLAPQVEGRLGRAPRHRPRAWGSPGRPAGSAQVPETVSAQPGPAGPDVRAGSAVGIAAPQRSCPAVPRARSPQRASQAICGPCGPLAAARHESVPRAGPCAGRGQPARPPCWTSASSHRCPTTRIRRAPR